MKKLRRYIVPLVCLTLLLTWIHVSRLSHGHLVVNFLNVGQGDSILIQTPSDKIILIDGGPGTSVLTELNDVLPFLEKDIDLMVLTHPHSDHIEGLVAVLKRYNVDAALITGVSYTNSYYEEFLKDLPLEADVYFASAEHDFDFGDGVFLDVLYPFDEISGKEFDNLNNSSIVIRLIYGDTAILLTGDAEIEVEEMLLAEGVLLSSDILKAGHHGSRTASSTAFVQAVSPGIVVIECGSDNSFGHPHDEAMTIFEEIGADVYRTDLDGRVTMVF
ncbi:competence protein ComE [Candidatus Peregrinibacteria bacterium CG22_combo_CG10-13_8_21_14_all_44_10]|nr:MAG: competence protein ComE [Candidatus Peregrinibacteria bacterium CG22_combo_CG10-13_8_21_14_all_44_10]